MWNCLKYGQADSCSYLFAQQSDPRATRPTDVSIDRSARVSAHHCRGGVVWGRPSFGNNPAWPWPFQALEPEAEQQDQAWPSIPIHPLIYFNYSLFHPHPVVLRVCLGASGCLIHRAKFEGARTQMSGRAGLWGPSSETFIFEHLPTGGQSWTQKGLKGCMLARSHSPPPPLFFPAPFVLQSPVNTSHLALRLFMPHPSFLKW